MNFCLGAPRKKKCHLAQKGGKLESGEPFIVGGLKFFFRKDTRKSKKREKMDLLALAAARNCYTVYQRRYHVSRTEQCVCVSYGLGFFLDFRKKKALIVFHKSSSLFFLPAKIPWESGENEPTENISAHKRQSSRRIRKKKRTKEAVFYLLVNVMPKGNECLRCYLLL